MAERRGWRRPATRLSPVLDLPGQDLGAGEDFFLPVIQNLVLRTAPTAHDQTGGRTALRFQSGSGH